jgi:hypothetical protein
MESGPVMRPIWLAVNLIHHPDEPDGVETRAAVTTVTMTGDCLGDRLSKYCHTRTCALFHYLPHVTQSPRQNRQ